MAKFNATRFTHQDTSEYGQGKKVTTKILENDAKNTEYLLGELQNIQQYTDRINSITQAPVNPESQQNTTTQTIEKQEITDNKGVTHRLNPQTIHKFEGNTTNAQLTTKSINIGNGDAKIIHAPVITTGTATVTKKINRTGLTWTYKMIGTINGREGITINKLLEHYRETTTLPNYWPTSFSTWTEVETFIEDHWVDFSYFNDFCNLNYNICFYGVGAVRFPTWVYGTVEARINNDSPFFETDDMDADDFSDEYLENNPGNSTDLLYVTVGTSTLLSGITDDEIKLNDVHLQEEITEEQSSYSIQLPYIVNEKTIRVFLNNQLLTLGVDYVRNSNNSLTLYNVEVNDFVDVYYSPPVVSGNIEIEYSCSREDTQSQMMILPVTILYTGNNE